MSSRGYRGRNGRGRNHPMGDGRDNNRGSRGGRGPPKPDTVQANTAQSTAKKAYFGWRDTIKEEPVANDLTSIETLWTGALETLNSGDREIMRKVPKDLDDEDLKGRNHIKMLMSIENSGGGASKVVELALPFLQVITHTEFIGCLVVDTQVGNLYNFISGSNGTRAIPFFRLVCASLVEEHVESGISESTTCLEQATNAIAVALQELLKRERKVVFNDDIPGLVDTIENIFKIAGVDKKSASSQMLRDRIGSLRGLIDRELGRLEKPKEPQSMGVSTGTVRSTYHMPIKPPGDRHDNDKLDIFDIQILPTENEIRSLIPDFLPSTDLNQPHFLSDPVQRHLDTHFRLTRHDLFGELKQELAGLIKDIEIDQKILDQASLRLGNIHSFTYPRAKVHEIFHEKPQGLQIRIGFPQPKSLGSAPQRRTWWEESKRLERGVLLCLLLHDGRKCSQLFLTVSKRLTDPKDEYGLSHDERWAFVTATLASKALTDLQNVVRLSLDNGGKVIMMEIPGVLIGTFTPILENLQAMHKDNRLPFRECILPEKINSTESTTLDILPPVYARREGFVFSLKPILKDQNSVLSLSSTASPDDNTLIENLVAETNLDYGQCQGLVAGLCREYSLLQGPPGTGKSHVGVSIMRALLATATNAKLGPIVVVCYTNHALDQFLEHLVGVGIESIIRIGGQCKSSVIESKNLRHVAKEGVKSKDHNYRVATNYKALESSQESFEIRLDEFGQAYKPLRWSSVQDHLKTKYKLIYDQFSVIDKDGFRQVGKHPFDTWKQGVYPPREDPNTQRFQGILLRANQDVIGLSIQDKAHLVKRWTQEIQLKALYYLFASMQEADGILGDISRIHSEADVQILSNAEVIGVTTSGLAKNMKTLQQIQSKVMICEEAGEICEAHMLSTLLPSVEHVISIGDHEQLRPQINNFNLSMESKDGKTYQLDRSQFERLSVGEPGRLVFPVAQLNVQRRMRPEISTLIRSTIYPRLIDHESTKTFPNVVGLRDNVFWLTHQNIEEGGQMDKSKRSYRNSWEVEMTFALVRHIIRQGVYKSDEIAVLAPYTGQLQKLRTKFSKEYEIVLSDRDQEALVKDGFKEESHEKVETSKDITSTRKPITKKTMNELLRVATVDNFQGEEAKIVIVSLVRSNAKGKVGFLKTRNRINVLLSRAKHGLFLIGNSETYSSVPMWDQVINMLQDANSIGKSLQICCPRHPDTAIEVSTPEDFDRNSPEGGCELSCKNRLSCGHSCSARCHSDSLHETFHCPEECLYLHKICNHRCRKATCGEAHGLCLEPISNFELPCMHTKEVKCWQTRPEAAAKVLCDFPLEKVVPGCEHMIMIDCSIDVTDPEFKCTKPCTAILADCGHFCSGSCGKCNTAEIEGTGKITKHAICTKLCGRKQASCNHNCPERCHTGPCPNCQVGCEVECSHSRCFESCSKTCSPCLETCTWFCEHQGDEGICKMPCAAPCNRLPCNERCSKLLSCNCRCPSVCGEVCPEGFCQKCSDKQDMVVDMLEFKEYREIDLGETPIVVLSCGHFYTTQTLDGIFGMSEVYEMDAHGNFVGLKETPGKLIDKIPSCPECKHQIRQFVTPRYNRILNKAVMDEMSKRFLVSGQVSMAAIEQKLENLDTDLAKSFEDVRRTLRSRPDQQAQVARKLKQRFDLTERIRNELFTFQQNVATSNQPAQKLLAAIAVFAHRQKPVEEQLAVLNIEKSNNSLPAPDRRITMGGRGLRMKFKSVVLADRYAISRILKELRLTSAFKLPGGQPENESKKFLTDCSSFIAECQVDKLPRLAVESTIYYAKVAEAYHTSCRMSNNTAEHEKAIEFREQANKLLEDAKELCLQPFQHADVLGMAVGGMLRVLAKSWQGAAITAEELASIKLAMVSGRGGIATHSGHWYNCCNGHPFAIGECGMPMEIARCPECGSPIGGQDHNPLDGVSRAMNMED